MPEVHHPAAWDAASTALSTPTLPSGTGEFTTDVPSVPLDPLGEESDPDPLYPMSSPRPLRPLDHGGLGGPKD